MNCEVCGNPIHGEPQTVLIEGASMRVCGNCAKLGTKITQTVPRPSVVTSRSLAPLIPRVDIVEDELVLRDDFGTVIKEAREELGLTQDEFAMKLNERVSLIKHLETGKIKPNDMLAAKLERFLKIDLYVSPEYD